MIICTQKLTVRLNQFYVEFHPIFPWGRRRVFKNFLNATVEDPVVSQRHLDPSSLIHLDGTASTELSAVKLTTVNFIYAEVLSIL
jgi:hypothetical protein